MNEATRLLCADQQNDHNRLLRRLAKQISATRSASEGPWPIDEILVSAGVHVKTKATSQTLDMLRVAMNVSEYSDLTPSSFDIFFRRNQHIWDGAPGMAFCRAAGRQIVGLANTHLLPLADVLLAERLIPHTLVGDVDCVSRFLSLWP